MKLKTGRAAAKFLKALPDANGTIEIGDHISGQVYEAKFLGTKELVAVKVCEVAVHHDDDVERVCNEIQVLEALQEVDNVVRFRGAYQSASLSSNSNSSDTTLTVLVVTEYCDYGSLQDFARHLRKAAAGNNISPTHPMANGLDENTIAYILREVLRGIAAMHSRHLMHRDIKGGNVLVRSSGDILLADFDTAASFKKDEKMTGFGVVGTPYWAAPEIAACAYPPGYSYDERCDVWSLGITAIEVAQGGPPLLGRVDPEQAGDRVLKQPPPALADSEHWTQTFKDFVSECLVKDFEHRQHAYDLLQHKFMIGIDEQAAKNAIRAHPYFKVSSEDVTDREANAIMNDARRSVVGDKLPYRATDNLALADDLTEEYIVNTLETRFMSSVIYTHVGDILIAMNPYKNVPLYTEDFKNSYSLDRTKPSTRPHVFEVALRSFKAMVHEGVNQSCVISGESGAGKTETAKYFIRHLLDLSSGGDTGLAAKYEVMRFALNEMLEAFGNAQTRMNRNSSRFGKYVEISFDRHHHAVGARLSQYLLEKSRVVRQSENERNFHVFYYVMAGLSQRQKRDLGIEGDVKDFAYVNGGVTSLLRANGQSPTVQTGPPRASDQYSELVDEMQKAGFSSAEVKDIVSTLAVILCTGNVDFSSSKSPLASNLDYETFFDLDVTGSLEKVAKLLGADKEDLGSALCSTIMITRGETIFKNNSTATARDARDAMAKALYGKLFSWIVNRVNEALFLDYSATEESTIGVLDIFGFENLQTNTLEQLCINITNEHLQSFFNEHIFAWQAKEFAQEGIDATLVGYEDNAALITLLMGNPVGLLNLVDEESRFPAASDRSLIQKLHIHCSTNNGLYVKPQDSKALHFTINHFAGDIQYDVSGWIEKNRDTLTPSVVSLLRESKNKLIRLLFSTSQSETGALVAQDNTSRVQQRQENAREMIAVLRRSIWRRTPSAPDRSQLMDRRMKQKKSQQQQDGNGIGNGQAGAPRPRKTPSMVLGQTSSKRMTRLDSMPSLPLTKTVKKGPATVCGHFKASLVELVLKLEQTQPNFIRCIQPTRQQVPNVFEHKHVERQLRYTGVLQTVKIRQEGYATRVPFAEFLQRYRVVHFEYMEKITDMRGACQEVLMHVSCNPGDWQLGHSKVFMRYNVVAELLKILEFHHMMGLRISRMVRRFLFRCRFQRLLRRLREDEKRAKEEAARRKREAEEAARRRKEEEERLKKQAEEAERKRQQELKRKEEEAKRLEQTKAFAESTVGSVLQMARGVAAQTLLMLAEAANLPETDEADVESEASKARTLNRRSHMGASVRSLAALQSNAGMLVVKNVVDDMTQEDLSSGPACMGPMLSEEQFKQLDQRLLDVSQLPEGVLPLCRYKNVLPTPATRVRLPSLAVRGIPVEHAEFINANWVRDWTGERRYIATQGPKPNTVEHFWRMVWEYDCPLIVMVTSLVENGRIKCHRYWPEFSGAKGSELVSNVMELDCGMLVEVEEVERYREYAITYIRLQWNNTEKFVRHMHLHHWPDYGVPKSTRSLVTCVDVIRDIMNRAEDDKPLVVHCSAGIGRTGIVLSVLMGVEVLLARQRLHMPAIVQSLRCDRGGMMQTFEQYEFSFKALGAYARREAFMAYLMNNTDKQQQILDMVADVLKTPVPSVSQSVPPANASEQEMMRAQITRFCEFMHRGQAEPVLGFPELSAFCPGWHLQRDVYALSLADPSAEAARGGKHRRKSSTGSSVHSTAETRAQNDNGGGGDGGEDGDGNDDGGGDSEQPTESAVIPFHELLFVDEEQSTTMRKGVMQPVIRLRAGSGNAGEGHSLNLLPFAHASKKYALNLDGEGVFLITDPRDGDVYVVNNTFHDIRVRSIESSVALWIPGHPCINAKRARLVCAGQTIRLFNTDTLRHAMSHVMGAHMDKGKKALMHAVSMCQADILLHPTKHTKAVIRVHYRAAAAEMARCFDAILDSRRPNQRRRSSVVELLGSRWFELNKLAADRPISRAPSPVNDDMFQGHDVTATLAPPTGREPLFGAEEEPPALGVNGQPVIATDADAPAPPPRKRSSAVITTRPLQQQEGGTNASASSTTTAASANADKDNEKASSGRGEHNNNDDDASVSVGQLPARPVARRGSIQVEGDSAGANVADFRRKLRRTSNVRLMEATPEMHAAATVLQAAVRGFLERFEVRARKNRDRRKKSFMFFHEQAGPQQPQQGKAAPLVEVTRRNSRSVLLKQKVSERQRPEPKNTKHLEPKVERATILKFKRPPKKKKRKSKPKVEEEVSVEKLFGVQLRKTSNAKVEQDIASAQALASPPQQRRSSDIEPIAEASEAEEQADTQPDNTRSGGSAQETAQEQAERKPKQEEQPEPDEQQQQQETVAPPPPPPPAAPLSVAETTAAAAANQQQQQEKEEQAKKTKVVPPATPTPPAEEATTPQQPNGEQSTRVPDGWSPPPDTSSPPLPPRVNSAPKRRRSSRLLRRRSKKGSKADNTTSTNDGHDSGHVESAASPRPRRDEGNSKAGKSPARRPSLLRRLSTRKNSKRRNSATKRNSMDGLSEEKDSDEESEPFDALLDEMDDDTKAFFQQLEANRAEREREAEQRRLQLAAEAALQRQKEQEELNQELDAIRRRTEAEIAREEKERDKVVEETQGRLQEMTFDFTFN
ncbi:STE/STE20 protein kinase [Salpingoeca rosetta]|uniref:non-specific serine/threonine protein kinase n=1 Tax=Salpingoeca rosetta (strain ATCC 50818 / BSB-021) TaxID=946362 RepID=F2UKZ1_SALR5|nr:STE/STE20 protein kinase [Salpingoeca rosetta]EGD77790.1 STE/STE20 protein kinase [Salpingoeca rosetta]|eukprot:XP_004990266.1 STE/STE20 protein kinase [Salpingoeca rosetta]